MKIKKGYLIRKMGDGYIVVTVGAANKEFNGIIRVNEAGKYLWDLLKTGITENELVSKMLERYDDLDGETARTDLREFLDSIHIAIEE